MRFLFVFFLHNRRKHPANILQKLDKKIAFTICFGNFAAVVLQIENVILHVCNHFRAVKARAALVVEVETAKIHIGTADHTKIVIRYYNFGVDKARSIFVYFYPCRKKLAIIGARSKKYDLLVGNSRCEDAHVYAALCAPFQCRNHFFSHRHIGSSDIETFL